ncbi:MAG: hypothetical protein BAJALOKI1v1_390016 [Promethearchaeota archaeon]|nr:MAG: hypothetical protein BAJALOKI1v1_390016 [Candidatus Lokiarchaeota archaeon]
MFQTYTRQEKFLDDFQERYQQGKELLTKGDHHWSTRLLVDLYFKIESEVWISSQKKKQLTLRLSNLWINYIKSLENNGEITDLIKYIDAYDRFFSFLLQVEDYNLFQNSINELLKSFVRMDDLSLLGLSKFINSTSRRFTEQGNYIQVIELQFLLTHLKESLVHANYFDEIMEHIYAILLKIEPSKRPLFLYTIVANVSIKFDLGLQPKNFSNDIIKKVMHMLPAKLKEYFSEIDSVVINERTFDSIQDDLYHLITYLNNIGESSWTMVIIRNLYYYVKEFRSFDDSIQQIRQFIEFSADRSHLNIVYTIYDYLESILLLNGEGRQYSTSLIELWAEACNKFADMKEKEYLLLSIERLNKHLRVPQDESKFVHYLHTCNYLWKYRSIFFSFREEDFWRMIYYRAIYQENDLALAQKIISYMDEKLHCFVEDCQNIQKIAIEQKNTLYTLEEPEDYYFKQNKLHIVNMVIKIDNAGEFSYRIYYSDDNILEKTFKKEHWNDTYIIKIYNDLFSDISPKKYDFTLKEFGTILYLLLPKVIRDYFAQFRTQILRPQIYFVFDKMTIPFEFIYKKGFFLFGYSIGYNIGTPPIMGAKFLLEKEDARKSLPSSTTQGFEVLLIDSINALAPKKWVQEENRKVLLYEFSSGANELTYIKDLFENQSEIQNIQVLQGSESTTESILDNISQGKYHIIYFVGNIIFSESHPSYSYFITNNNSILKFVDLFDALEKQVQRVKPILFFDTQMFDREGNKLKEGLAYISEIISELNYNNIKGVVCRHYPEFDTETKKMINKFFTNLFEKNSLGISLLKAREVFLPKIPKLIKQQLDAGKTVDPDIDKSKNVTIENSQQYLGFLIFGEPWNKL